MPVVIGLDVGGTFTDVVMLDTRSGEIAFAKTLSTPEDLTVGVTAALSALPAAECDLLIHGTTIATNALLEHKTARAGLITTKGFRDVVEIRRRDRPHTYGLRGTFEPIIPRFLRKEVAEYVNSRGEVELAVDPEDVISAAQGLLESGAEAIGVAFLNSYANPSNELVARQALERVWPNDFISVSTEIFPEFREFERWVTTSANASLQPLIGEYLQDLRAALKRVGQSSDLLVMQSNGGAMPAERARQLAVATVLSGPAAGVSAAQGIGRIGGYKNVISCDMGGTSFDVCLIAAGRVPYSNTLNLEYGMPLQIPTVDIHTIGAGGGSIARVDRSGILRVGPDSAGASPGPAAYGRGGSEPTVTDAHVILGRIGVEAFEGGGSLNIDPDAARRAAESQVAQPLGLSVEDAALAILAVANMHLAGAVRRVSMEKGFDPREFVLMMFGGAGPLHACSIMRELAIQTSVIPPLPGLTSAMGCALADFRYDFVRTVNFRLKDLDPSRVERILREQEVEGRQLVHPNSGLIGSVSVSHEADMSYEAQTHTVRVKLPTTGITTLTLSESFESAYAARFGRTVPGAPAHIVNLRSTVIGHREPVRRNGGPSNSPPQEIRNRKCYFDGSWYDTPVLKRGMMTGDAVSGPCIVEQEGATIVIEPDAKCRPDEHGNLLIELTQRSRESL